MPNAYIIDMYVVRSLRIWLCWWFWDVYWLMHRSHFKRPFIMIPNEVLMCTLSHVSFPFWMSPKSPMHLCTLNNHIHTHTHTQSHTHIIFSDFGINLRVYILNGNNLMNVVVRLVVLESQPWQWIWVTHLNLKLLLWCSTWASKLHCKERNPWIQALDFTFSPMKHSFEWLTLVESSMRRECDSWILNVEWRKWV